MKPEIVIREEVDADANAIAEVTVAAFKTLAISNHTEQFIVEALRAANAPRGIVEFHEGFKAEGRGGSPSQTLADIVDLGAVPRKESNIMTTVSVRYIVDDLDKAVSFYTKHLGFSVEMKQAPGFAMLSRGELRLLLNVPGAGGAGQAMPDGTKPRPGGWNRIQLEVDDLESFVKSLSDSGARFRNDIVTGRGGKQVLLDDPAGNCIELFEPERRPDRS